jgi:signal transduction histidine kinase
LDILRKSLAPTASDIVDVLPPSRAVTTWLASTVLAVACLDLFGWRFHVPLLTSILPRYATMKPNTAVCMGLLALAILLKRRRQPATVDADGRRNRRSVASIMGSIAAGLTLPVALAIVIEDVTGHRLAVDHLIVMADVDIFSSAAGRMALGTSLCVALIAATLILLDWKPKLSTAALLSGAALSLSAVIGFVFDAGPFFGVSWMRSIAVSTAVSLLLLQFATLVLRPEREPYASLSHANRSGRRQWLLLGVTVVPVIVAFPLLFGMKSGLMDAPFALALLVVVLVSIQTIILWQDSKALVQVENRRRKTEQALLQSEKLAVVGRLAASISHEINNPLEAIGNILYLVRNAESLDAAREYALMAEQELSRVAQITTQTLSYYRENRLPALYLPSAIMESALTLLAGKINSSRVEVRVDFAGELRSIHCRDGELRQVFVNLISNAIEATPAGGHVVVRVRSSVEWRKSGAVRGVRVLIADSGRGIPPEFRLRIFEPFFTTKAHETGNGLGLWVVQDLIEKQGGSIRMVSSTLRGWKGTTFSVFLPYQEAAAEEVYGVGEETADVEPV